MSGPTRQRSLRERLHGISLSWQGKKSKSYSSKDGQSFPENESLKSGSLDSRSCDPIHAFEEDANIRSSDSEQQEAKKEEEEPVCPSTATYTETSMDVQEKHENPPDQTGQSAVEKKVLTRSLTQPKGTTEYVVRASDTLPGIAARFDTTPSELAKLNRLTSRLIFPEQVLFVPEKKKDESINEVENSNLETVGGSKQETAKEERTKEAGAELNPLREGQTTTEIPMMPRKTSVSDPLRIAHRRFSERMQRFLKVKARHFTDGQGVVSGVLIITPNAVMFDPNVSDPLVIEHGTESYGVIAPLDMVIRTAIYYDIAHMKVKHAPEAQQSVPKADVYYGKATMKNVETQEKRKEKSEAPQPNTDADLKPRKDTLPPEEGKAEKSEESRICRRVESVEKEKKEEKKESLPEAPTATEASRTVAQEDIQSENKPGPRVDKKEEESSPGEQCAQGGEETNAPAETVAAESADAQLVKTRDESSKPTESRRERMLKRLSYPMESITSYTQSSISRILSSSPKTFVDFRSGLFVRNSEEEKTKELGQTSVEEEVVVEESEKKEGSKDIHTKPAEPEVPEQEKKSDIPEEKVEEKIIASEADNGSQATSTPQQADVGVVGYKNLVEDKPELFAALDRLLAHAAVQEHEGPPLYLCLRMGRPKDRKIKLSTPILSYGKKRVKSEYWFSIPHNRVEDLYLFLQQWIPHLYGDVDDADPQMLGFIPIDDTEDEEEEEEEKNEEEGDDPDGETSKRPKSPRSLLRLVEDHFGFKSISPTDWEVLSMSDGEKSSCVDFELPMPDLLEHSDILDNEHMQELYPLLPARAVGYPWTLIYSTSKHGFNLKTLYRRMALYDTPILMVIADTEGAVFGGLVSSPLRLSEKFYGTGESFLFTFHPEFKVYYWTGDNMYFVKGDAESIAIGAGDGQFGLWLDGDLYHGRSKRCKTFENDTLSVSEDFVIKAMEAWGFV